MNAVINLPARTSCHWLGIDSNITKRLAIRFSDKIEIKRHTINNNVLGKYWGRNRILAMASKRDPNSQQNSLSSAETVDQYFTSINGKDLRQLDECISEDACFEDHAFTKPFQGKKEVMHFLQQLTECMGRNVKFRVKHIYEGDDLTAAANWHMEWKEKQIPFTRGCTFFKLTKLGKNLIIWRTEVLIESPIKPGTIVLTLLKNVTSTFDNFPKLAEWFLRSPHVILSWILKVYNIFIACWLHPLLDGYIKLWSFFVRLLSSAITLVIFISKTFFN
ncbi:uncharacterized protein HKW66_Vig0161990 [Vigna angularis]|uniref:SnoaL-like domain-containing protein n=2 Tax=Phaseolus angularis TaxID=3914 RepID=A0A8T0JKI8_PHAAN|nr:uncharacterized protein LOC108320344 [Vigna angularis]KAG2375647.1 uncharacterized protein HKW66_Vig0161990 [Vigna angularis]BAU00585.1 hypothetical protein VIGAN_10219400 [Vigna angularis var. angularis]